MILGKTYLEELMDFFEKDTASIKGGITIDYQVDDDGKKFKALLPGVKNKDIILYVEEGYLKIKFLNEIKNPFISLSKDSIYAFNIKFDSIESYSFDAGMVDGILVITANKIKSKEKDKKRIIDLS